MTRILSTLAVATATSCLLLLNNIPAAHAEVQQVMMMYEIDPNDAHENTAQHLRIFDGNTDHRRHLSFWTSFLNHIICPHHPHDCPHGGGGGGSGGGSGGSGSGSGGSSNTGTSNTNTGSTNTNTNTNTGTGTSQSIYSTETGFDLYVSNGDGSYTIFDEDDYQNNQTPELWYQNQNQNGGGDGDDNGNGGGDGNGNGGGDGWTRFDLYYQNEDEEYVEYNPGNNNGGGNNNGNGDGDGGNGNGGDGGTPDLWYKNDEGEWTVYRTSPDYYDYDNSKVSNDCDTENDVDCVRDLKVNAMLKDLGVGMIGLGGIAVIGALVARSRRTNVNMDEHLLSGAVGKRKKTFTGLFRQKPKDFAATATTPDATHYVNAV